MLHKVALGVAERLGEPDVAWTLQGTLPVTSLSPSVSSTCLLFLCCLGDRTCVSSTAGTLWLASPVQHK